MTRVVFLACRGLFTLVCLLTSVYCLLAFLPFTYQNVIEFKVVGWTGDFALLHPWLWWIALIGAAWTIADDYRAGTRALVVGFLIAGAASGVALVASPLLAGIRNEFRSLVWAGLWLAPLWWIAAIDLLGAGRHLRWNGRDQRDGARVFWSCAAAGVAVPLVYAGIHAMRTGAAGGTGGPDPWSPGVAAWSVGLHLLTFLALFALVSLVRALSAASRRPALWEFALLGAAEAIVLAAVIRTVVFPAVSFLGTEGLVMAAFYAASLTVAAAGMAVRIWPPSEPVRSGLDLAARPFTVAPDGPVMVRVFVLVVWVGLAYMLAVSTARMDWNYLLQSLAALAIWLLGLAWIYAVLPHTGPQRPATALVMLAIPVVLLLGYRGLVANPPAWPGLGTDAAQRSARLERYAGYDVSFRLVQGIFRPMAAAAVPGGVDMGAFYALLQQHTNIPRTVKIDVPDLGLVPQVTPGAARLPHIFIIVIDSLRQDYLSPYNPAVTFTPSVAAFAQGPGTVVFRQAFTRYGATGLSEPAIWTGRMVPHQQYPSPFGQANSLQKLVRGLGYEAFVSVDVPLQAVLSRWPELTELDKGIANRDYEVGRTLKELEAKLRARPSDDGRPVFAYTQPQNIHVSAIAREGTSVVDGADYTGFYAPYASRVRQIDAAFGRFIAALRELNLYDDSIVVFTSDHGDSLGEDGRFGHAYTIYPEILRIPIIVHLPTWLRDRPRDVSGVTLSTDLTPTLYDLLGQRPLASGPLVGRPLFSDQAGERRAHRDEGFVVASSYGPVYGWIAGDGASLYIADATSFREYAYDLTTGVAGTPRPVTPALREGAAARIRTAIDEVARTYRVPAAR